MAAEALKDRGDAFLVAGRLAEALASYDSAIAIKPDFVEAHANRAFALERLNRPLDALAGCDRAIALGPDCADPHKYRGFTLQTLARQQEAIASFDRAIALKPDDADARFNRAMSLLACGRYKVGWPAFETRKQVGDPSMYPFGEDRLWLGEEDVRGKVVLVTHEQGLGDTLQFCRYVKLLGDAGADVVLTVQHPLKSLLQEAIPAVRVIGPNEPTPAFDYHCPLMSLPLAFRTEIDTIPNHSPYLTADPDKSHFWRERLGPKVKYRVGLVWNGGFRPGQQELEHINARRNISFELMSTLNMEGIEFYSLQKGHPAETELVNIRHRLWPSDNFHIFASTLFDFSYTAALIDNLDLVISVDTSTAHLAGAMGKPVWILNRFDSCWRWLMDRDDSPWYPSARLFRQPSLGDWGSVMAQVRNELAAQVAVAAA